jgi:nitrate reductase NapE component
MTENTTPPTNATPLYCANHPGVETTLRCNHCDKLICPKCAVRTPTGYRCKECVRGQLKVFDTAQWYDYLLGFIAAGILSLVASGLIALIGGIGFIGWFLVIAGAPTAGVAIAEATRFVLRRRRSRALFITVLVAVVLGALPVLLVRLLVLDFFGIAFQGIYLVLATPTVYYRLSGIQLFK